MEKLDYENIQLEKINNDTNISNDLLEIFVDIHNQNFETKIETKYFMDIIKNNMYDMYFMFSKSQNSKIIYNNNKIFVLGYIIFYDTLDSIDLFEIAIQNKIQGQGLGNRLFNNSKNLLFNEEKYINRDKNYKNILLEVNENNKKAINLYKKNEFVKISTRKDYYSKNQNAIIMIKYENKKEM